jgi:Spy/CpxP family protein refolding chaperone
MPETDSIKKVREAAERRGKRAAQLERENETLRQLLDFYRPKLPGDDSIEAHAELAERAEHARQVRAAEAAYQHKRRAVEIPEGLTPAPKRGREGFRLGGPQQKRGEQ